MFVCKADERMEIRPKSLTLQDLDLYQILFCFVIIGRKKLLALHSTNKSCYKCFAVLILSPGNYSFITEDVIWCMLSTAAQSSENCQKITRFRKHRLFLSFFLLASKTNITRFFLP